MKKSILLMVANMNVGGTESSLLSLLSVLPQDRYDVTVLLLEKNGGYLGDIPEWVHVDVVDGFEKMKPVINDPPLVNIINGLKSKKFLEAIHLSFIYVKVKLSNNWTPFYGYALKKYKVNRQFDIAVAYAGPSNFISYFIANNVEAKRKLQWIHFDVTKLDLNKKFGEEYYKFFDKIYCVSEGSKKEMAGYFPKYSSKIDVFENIISPEKIKESAKTGATFDDEYQGVRILTLGRLSEEKGQLMIPAVVEKLKQDGFDFRWYCIGDGVIRKKLENLIIDNEIQDHLVLLGLQKNPYRFLRDTDIYVQTSFHEGYGLTIHEAKICNRPMVITEVASARDLIRNYETGLIVDINEDSIYEGVKKLLANKELRGKFQNNLIEENKQPLSYVENIKKAFG